MADHAYRKITENHYFVFGCKCGEIYGRQPEMSHVRGREAHRAHMVAVVKTEEVQDLWGGGTFAP